VPSERRVVAATDITRRFITPSGVVTALDRVDFDIVAGTLTVVAGPSGSGKSVLLSMISCTDRPSAGTVRVDDQVVSDLGRRARRRFRRDRLGIVLPQPSDNLLDRISAIENVRWAERVRRPRAGDAEHSSAALMEVVGISSVAHKSVRQLSGGEQQRVALVCALVGNPLLLVADEPTASLDATSSLAVVTALRSLGDRGVTMVVATHDPHVADVADSVIRLDHGRRVP
jgi:ABC-type lipoprotein export system ATPase subunit